MTTETRIDLIAGAILTIIVCVTFTASAYITGLHYGEAHCLTLVAGLRR